MQTIVSRLYQVQARPSLCYANSRRLGPEIKEALPGLEFKDQQESLVALCARRPRLALDLQRQVIVAGDQSIRASLAA